MPHYADGTPAKLGDVVKGKTSANCEILGTVAKGGTNPDLQLKAIRYLGVMNSPGNDLEGIAGQVGAGCNLFLFATGNGSIKYMYEHQKFAIGVDTDQYISIGPPTNGALLTSAQKAIDEFNVLSALPRCNSRKAAVGSPSYSMSRVSLTPRRATRPPRCSSGYSSWKFSEAEIAAPATTRIRRGRPTDGISRSARRATAPARST